MLIDCSQGILNPKYETILIFRATNIWLNISLSSTFPTRDKLQTKKPFETF